MFCGITLTSVYIEQLTLVNLHKERKFKQMVKLLATGVLALSLSLVTPVLGRAEEYNTLIEESYTYKYATSAGVNIRKEPNTDSEILGKTLLNTEFQTVEDVDGWTKITTEAGYAYIKSEYLSDTEIEYIPLGKFKVSHYCIEPHKHICGTGTGLTKLGNKVHPGSLSVDPRVIPLGSTVMINGREYVAEDTGGAIKGNKIDMAVATHKEALNLGVYYAEVYLKVK